MGKGRKGCKGGKKTDTYVGCERKERVEQIQKKWERRERVVQVSYR